MTVLRRVAGVILVVLGLASIAVAVASATVWRPSDVVTARASAQDAAMMVTAPGVIDLVGDEVTVTATAPGTTPVVIVLGDERDVAGWVGADPFVEITGLESWTALATREGQPGDGEATAAEAGLPDPSSSDMWFDSARGEGSASLTSTGPADRTQVLVVVPGTSGATPDLELSWPREVATPLLVPGVVVGSVLVLAGIALAVSSLVAERRRRGVAAPASPRSPASVSSGGAPGAEAATVGAAPTGEAPETAGTPVVPTSAPVSAEVRSAMTRRELRELAEREAAEREAAERAARASERRSRPRTGILPAVRRATLTGQVPRVPEPEVAQPPATPAPETPVEPAAPDANRADAWRQAWGFGQTSWAPVQPRDTPVDDAGSPAAPNTQDRPGGSR